MSSESNEPLFDCAQCSLCGAVRPVDEMARSLGATDDYDRYWCHGATDAAPTCYTQADWDGEIWLAEDAE
jgi:hypothetical protein